MKKALILLGVFSMFGIAAIPVTSYPLRLLHEYFNSEYTTRMEIKTTIVVVASIFTIASLIRVFFKVCESIKKEDDD